MNPPQVIRLTDKVAESAINQVITDIYAQLTMQASNIEANKSSVSGAGVASSYIMVSDHKPANTAGGTFTLGAWRTRTLNTKDSDTDNICSLSSNQITLPAGTYLCCIKCPGMRVSIHKAKLYNCTDGVDTLIGSNAYTSSGGAYASIDAFVVGKFTITAQKVFEVRHRGIATEATDGFGVACNFTVDEIYTVAEFWKIA